MKTSTIEKIIILGLAAAGALYAHSVYIAASKQSDVPGYIAAGSKILGDVNDAAETGKSAVDYASRKLDEMKKYNPEEGKNGNYEKHVPEANDAK